MKAMKPGDPAHLKAAYEDLGLKEIRGKQHNPRVVEMFALSGHGWVQDDETAWCAAAVGAWFKESGMVGSGSLAARSYLKWGKRTTRPKRGDVVVFSRGKPSWQGHVAFYLGRVKGRVCVIGGNQRNAVTVTTYAKTKLLGYRKPSTMWNSKVVQAAGMTGAGTGYSLLNWADYVPDVMGLLPTGGETDWPSVILVVAGGAVIAACGFFIWDRWVKARELGI